jgi:hypothetical protein
LDKKTGRYLQQSPFFTDGQYFYVLSTVKDVRKIDEDEDRKETQIVLEKYDPSTSKFLHVSSTPLFRAKDEELKFKGNQDDFAKLMCFTNGENLYLRHDEENLYHVHNMNSGLRLTKQSTFDSADETCNLSHDPVTGLFYRFNNKNDLVEC